MKVIFHERYKVVYASDPAAREGRIESILREIKGRYEFLQPKAATEEDLRRVHTQGHIDSIKRNPLLYEIASLSAGGGIKAAEVAMRGEPTFGLIRPPGHHASPNYSWGFCFFNNIAVALTKLQLKNQIDRALILDFDLHFGDGTNNIFAGRKVEYFQPKARDRESFVEEIKIKFDEESEYDILAVSAGFDRHVEDWGGMLTTEDYRVIGQRIKNAAQSICKGRRFALLEGGYNHDILGKNVKSFLEGLD